MTPDKATAAATRTQTPAAPSFTVAEANRALVLVRKVVADIVTNYKKLVRLRDQRDDLLHEPGREEHVEAVTERLTGCVEQLNALRREVQAIGCTLKDWRTGLVDFPALRGGHRVWLCWRLGEPSVTYWHDLNEGFAARRPIGDDFN